MSLNEYLLSFSCGVKNKYSPGQILFSQGDESDALFVIEQGEIEIFLLTKDGKKLSLNVLTTHEIFGEIGVLDGGSRTAFAIAKNHSVVKKIAKREILEEIHENSKFAIHMIEVLCSRIRWINEQVEHLAIPEVEERLAKKLVILHNKFSDKNGSLNLSQSEISEFLGTSRETVNKVLQAWRSKGHIELSRGSLKIVNLDNFMLQLNLN